jgi:putative PIN family toxin of toxin-antitoxin system
MPEIVDGEATAGGAAAGGAPLGEAIAGAADAERIDVVVDTNIWLDLLVFDDISARRLAGLLRPGSRLRALAAEPMRAELADVVTRPQFRLGDEARFALLARFDAMVTAVPVAPDCRLPCRDPDDRQFLDLAVSRRAAWLLSRDRALLDVRKLAWHRFGLRIGRSEDFYRWMDEGSPR